MSYDTTIVEETEDLVMEDYAQTTLEDLDAFETHSWSKGVGYKLPNFETVEKNLEGVEAGFYLFAAESNVGKSALMLNMMYDLCTYEENKLFGIYYSLDDSKNEIIPRVIAMDQLIPISAASKPQRYQDLINEGDEYSELYQDILDKRNLGLQKLRECNNMFKIEDSNKIKSIEDLYQHAKQLQIYIKAIDPEMNIVIAIDSINDLKFSEQKFSSTTEKHAEAAKTVKQWTVELDCIIMASTHLRKINQNRRPSLDDLKESGEYVYEASLVWLLYNDVSKNKQAAKIYYNQETRDDKCPIMELDWAKNKKSSYKGRTYCYFSPEYSKVVECGDDVNKRFDALIYQKC